MTDPIPPDAWAAEIRKKEKPDKAVVWDFFDVVEPTTACKHGRQDCEECGTTSRRDVLHRTRRGRGSVGRLRGRP